VLKSYQNYFFVNFKTNNQWVLRVIQRETNGSLLFLSIDLGDEKNNPYLLDGDFIIVPAIQKRVFIRRCC